MMVERGWSDWEGLSVLLNIRRISLYREAKKDLCGRVVLEIFVLDD